MDNDTRLPQNIANEIARAQKVYQDLGEDFTKRNNGKFISVEPQSGDHFIGITREEAVKKANEKYKGKIVFTRRIGNLEKVALHSPLELCGDPYARVL